MMNEYVLERRKISTVGTIFLFSTLILVGRGGPLFLIHLLLKEKMKTIKVNFSVEISDEAGTTSSNMDTCTTAEHFNFNIK